MMTEQKKKAFENKLQLIRILQGDIPNCLNCKYCHLRYNSCNEKIYYIGDVQNTIIIAEKEYDDVPHIDVYYPKHETMRISMRICENYKFDNE